MTAEEKQVMLDRLRPSRSSLALAALADEETCSRIQAEIAMSRFRDNGDGTFSLNRPKRIRISKEEPGQ